MLVAPMRHALCGVLLVPAFATMMRGEEAKATNPYINLMGKAGAHAKAHGAGMPVLSPVDATVLDGAVPLKELQAKGFKVVPWTTNDPEKMRELIRIGVDGVISDRPDLLQAVLKEERTAASTPEKRERLARFDVSA